MCVLSLWGENKRKKTKGLSKARFCNSIGYPKTPPHLNESFCGIETKT